MNDIITVYVCPSPSCDNYYGSSSMGTLEAQENISYIPGEGRKTRGFRSSCPQCGTKRVKRYAKLIPESEVAEATQKAMASPEVRRLQKPLVIRD